MVERLAEFFVGQRKTCLRKRTRGISNVLEIVVVVDDSDGSGT